MPRIHVLLADDHTLFRAGVRKLLDGIEDIEVVGEAGDGEEAIRLADTLHGVDACVEKNRIGTALLPLIQRNT